MTLLCFEDGIVSAYADHRLVGVLVYEVVADRTATVVRYDVDQDRDAEVTEARLLAAVTEDLGLTLIDKEPEQWLTRPA